MKKFTVKPKFAHTNRILIGSETSKDEYVFLGRLAEAGHLLRVDFDIFSPHVIAIFGKRGSGKSYTLGSFLEGLCTKESETSISRVAKKHAILLFDTLGIFQWVNVPLSPNSPQRIVKEQALLQKGWDINSEPLNVNIWSPRSKSPILERFNEFTINCADFSASDWGYLFGVDILQDRMGQLLNDVYEKVVNEGWSDGIANHPPKTKYAIEDLMECVQHDKEIAANYHSETRRAILQQLSVYWRNPLFQPKRNLPIGLKWLSEKGEISKEDLRTYESLEGTSLSSLLQPGMLSVLLLHKMPDELRFVIIISLIRKIMHTRIETSESEKNGKIRSDLTAEEKQKTAARISQGVPPTWIVADEAQNFLPSGRRTAATEVLVRLVREGRNFGLSFMLTTQQPSAIDQRILSQVDTLIVHKLTVQSDIEYIRHNLKAALPDEVMYSNRTLAFDDLMRSLDIGQAIVSNTETNRTFILDVRPRLSVHGGFGAD